MSKEYLAEDLELRERVAPIFVWDPAAGKYKAVGVLELPVNIKRVAGQAQTAGDWTSMLNAIRGQTDRLAFDANNRLKILIDSSVIMVPIDLQAILERKAELYDADETVAQSISLDTGGYKLCGVTCRADAATTFKVEYSYDNIRWFTHYTSPTAETGYHDVFWNDARYIKVSSAAAGAAGNKVTLCVGAKP